MITAKTTMVAMTHTASSHCPGKANGFRASVSMVPDAAASVHCGDPTSGTAVIEG